MAGNDDPHGKHGPEMHRVFTTKVAGPFLEPLAGRSDLSHLTNRKALRLDIEREVQADKCRILGECSHCGEIIVDVRSAVPRGDERKYVALRMPLVETSGYTLIGLPMNETDQLQPWFRSLAGMPLNAYGVHHWLLHRRTPDVLGKIDFFVANLHGDTKVLRTGRLSSMLSQVLTIDSATPRMPMPIMNDVLRCGYMFVLGDKVVEWPPLMLTSVQYELVATELYGHVERPQVDATWDYVAYANWRRLLRER